MNDGIACHIYSTESNLNTCTIVTAVVGCIHFKVTLSFTLMHDALHTCLINEPRLWCNISQLAAFNVCVTDRNKFRLFESYYLGALIAITCMLAMQFCYYECAYEIDLTLILEKSFTISKIVSINFYQL